jgi:hypothetical protein
MQPIDFNEQHQIRQSCAPEWASARRVMAGACPPDGVESALLYAFAQRHRPTPWYRIWLRAWSSRWSTDTLAPLGSLAAVACLLMVLVSGVRDTAHGPGAATAPAAVPALAQDFLPLADSTRIATAENAQLMRADLPRHVLVSLGVPINEDAPDELVQAEMLVAASGEPLAIRLALN